MAIFKKNEPQPQKPRDRSVAPSRGNQTDGAISIIGQGMTVVGDIATEGIIRVEGEVRGTIRAGKAVILGQAGVIDGNIFTDDAVVGGTVRGSIVAENRLELQATCTVEGEIHVRPEHLKLEEGARFAGQVLLLESPQPDEQTPALLQPSSSASVYSAPLVSNDHADSPPATEFQDAEESFGGQDGSDQDNGEEDHQEKRKKA